MRPTRKEEDGLISCFFLDFFSFTNRHIYLIHGKWRQAVSVQKKEEKETGLSSHEVDGVRKEKERLTAT